VAGQSLAYSATGLPPGVSVSTRGQLTGWVARPGTYAVKVTVSGGQPRLTGSVSFAWTVLRPQTGPTGPVRLSFGGKCLDDPHNASAAGTVIGIWDCNGTAAQRWAYVQDGTLRIHALCLTVSQSASAPAQVVLEPCTGGDRQQWRLAYPPSVNPAASGNIATTLANPSSRSCLADPAWNAANGTPALVRTAAQQWTVYPDGSLRVHGMCLDVTRLGAVDGIPAMLEVCNDRLRQHWRLIPHGGGAQLVNIQSGLCLADPGGTTVNGTRLQTRPCSAADQGMAWRPS
jgi:hypothetical protein